MTLVGISGKRGVGKSLLASILATRHGFTEQSFASSLKAGVRRDFNLKFEHTDGAKKEEVLPIGLSPRDLMIMYGNFFRGIDPDFWIKNTMKDINYIKDMGLGTKFVISDVRYENEANLIKAKGGFLVRLNRSPKLSIYKDNKAFAKDPSECSLDNYAGWDMLVSSIANETPNDLMLIAARIVEKLSVKR